MSCQEHRKSVIGRMTAGAITLVLLAMAQGALAQQIDIPGPPGRVSFGSKVAVLPNGNIVVTDPDGVASGVGGVYLYTPAGVLINYFTGSSAGDHVGSGGIVVLATGNYLVSSPAWSNSGAANAGAVTFVNQTSGLAGVVTAGNSLVGTSPQDAVGSMITRLANGNYVVGSRYWIRAGLDYAGAATWGNGNTGVVGAVSTLNSLVGRSAFDRVGDSITELSNGNYVVSTTYWHDDAQASVGAATWVNGNTGLVAEVSLSNSIVGATVDDSIAYLVNPLSNGNYVVVSPYWHNAANVSVGAVTWASGTAPTSAQVTAANSLVGTQAGDAVGGGGFGGVGVLTDGNYVVSSPNWSNATATAAGAATWISGSGVTSAEVGPANSLVGLTINDNVSGGGGGIVALPNGRYVVSSPFWHNGSAMNAGAATWAAGSGPLSAVVSSSNSLTGSGLADDSVGSGSIAVLSNGDYVVASPAWSNGPSVGVGAVTWAPGGTGLAGNVVSGNSLIGTESGSQVGRWVVALAGNKYAVGSPQWVNAGLSVGAATLLDGTGSTAGVVSAFNSLVGTHDGDGVGGYLAVLTKGNFVVASDYWDSSVAAFNVGAATWSNERSLVGSVSGSNSLVGSTSNDHVCLVGSGTGVVALSNGNYVVRAPNWSNNGVGYAGAISLGRRAGGTAGPIQATNSVLGTVQDGGYKMVFDYDATRDTLVVGQPAANIVSLFKADLLFVEGFN